MPKHLTEGKITYIHGAAPPRRESYIPDPMWPDGPPIPGVTLSQLEAGENDPALRQPMPAAPSIHQNIPIQMIYEADTHYDGTVTERHFAHPLVDSEPDEYAVWAPAQNRATPQRRRFNWPSIFLWCAIILMCTMIWAGVIGIASTVRFQDFLRTTSPAIQITPK